MKAGKAPCSQQLDEAIYRKPGGVGKTEPFMRLQVRVKGGMRAVWGGTPGPLGPNTVGQGRTAGEVPTPDTSPTAKGDRESSLNHREGWDARMQWCSRSADEELHGAGV